MRSSIFFKKFRMRLKLIVNKIKKVITNPYLLVDRLIVRKLSAGVLLKILQLNFLNFYLVATSLIQSNRYNDLLYLIKHYKFVEDLRLIIDFENKVESSRMLMQYLIKSNAYKNKRIDQLEACSKFYTAMGYFNAGWYFRIAWQVALLKHYKTTKSIKEEIAFEIACISRDKYINIAQDYEIELNFNDAIEKSILNFEGNYNESIRYLKQKSKQKQKCEHKAYIDEINKNLTSLVKEFEGKEVLLIGPSVFEPDNEINPSEYDYVARIGYSGEDSVGAFKEVGTDISHYKNHKLENIYNTGKANVLNNLKLMTVSNLKLDMLEKIKEKNIVYSSFTGPVLLNNEMNAGLEFLSIIIEDLELKPTVCNIDLFTNKTYPRGYISNNYKQNYKKYGWSLDDHTQCRSMALNHNPIAQFSFFYFLWRNKKFKADSTLEALMHNNIEEYINKLEKIYCPFNQGNPPEN